MILYKDWEEYTPEEVRFQIRASSSLVNTNVDAISSHFLLM